MDSATAKINRGKIIANTLNLHVCHFDATKPNAGITQPGWAVTHPTQAHPLEIQGAASELQTFKAIDTHAKEIASNQRGAGSISMYRDIRNAVTLAETAMNISAFVDNPKNKVSEAEYHQAKEIVFRLTTQRPATKENTMSETAAATTDKPSNNKKQLGDYRMPASDIPESLRGQVAKTLGVDSESLKMASAREGGSYYGKVLHADSNFIIQGVGKEGKSAVIHRASDVEFMSSSLKWRAENGRLGRGGESAANLQVHYAANGEPSKTARAYAYNPERQAQRESSKPEPAKAAPEKTEKAPAAKAEPATEKPKVTPQKAQADTPARTRKSRSKSADMER